MINEAVRNVMRPDSPFRTSTRSSVSINSAPAGKMRTEQKLSARPHFHQRPSAHPSPPRPSTPTTTPPYWNTNIPPSSHTSHCPPFLLNQPEKNIRILSTPDSSFTRQSWPEVRALVASNRIDAFQRLPSDLHRYLAYTYTLTKTHGSVLSYIQSHRLHWPTPSPSGAPPFTDPANYTVLYNDWPYGIDAEITHLVVWTKFTLQDDPATDDLTPAARALVDSFVQRVFGEEVGSENVIWFKNWRSLKSVHALEHFHVMLYRADAEFLRRVTRGDVTVAERLKGEEEGRLVGEKVEE